jgi:hypothetical protein
MNTSKNDQTANLIDKIEGLSTELEGLSLEPYMILVREPQKLFYINFLVGVVRGIGMAISFSLVGAIIVLVMQRLIVFNIPQICQFIAEISRIVDQNLNR